MKSYTDIEQSKKLAEILPLDSADMYWFRDNVEVPRMYPKDMMKDSVCVTCPCWSLTALLNIMPNTKLCHYNDSYFLQYMGIGDEFPTYSTMEYDGPIEACVEMIIKLNKLKML